MKVKKIISFVIALVILLQQSFTVFANEDLYLKYDGETHLYQYRPVEIYIGNEEVQIEDMPGIIFTDTGSSRTLVPAREVFEAQEVGAKVEWINDTREIHITYEDQFIRLQIDSDKAYVNNQEVILDVPAKLIANANLNNGYAKTMIPLRFVGETLGHEVDWDQEHYRATLVIEEDNQVIEDENYSEEIEEEIEEEIIEDIIEEDEEYAIEVPEGEQLDELDGSQAVRELPTPLSNNPVFWAGNGDVLEGITDLYFGSSIEEQDNDVIKIKKITSENKGNYHQYIVEADGPISSLDEAIWNDNLVLDVINAEWELGSSNQTFDDAYISSVRSSQFSDSPMTTRLVFDAKQSGIHFNVELSDNREKIIINALNNIVHMIEIGQDGEGDYIDITGLLAPGVEVFRLSHPDRLVLDLPNTLSAVKYEEAIVEGQYIKEIRTSQFTENTTRVVVETEGQADYRINQSGSSTKIRIIEPGFENMNYANPSVPTITIEKPEGIHLSDIKQKDLYLDREFVLEIPGNHLDYYGTGLIEVNDRSIQRVKMGLNDSGNTELTIQANRVFAYEIIETNEEVVLKARMPRDVYSQIIVVDPGHGGSDPGARANGLVEKTLNLDMTFYLKEFLDADDSIKTYYTRLDDSYPTLQERAILANEIEADIFLSIHNNAHNGSANGTETLYYPTTDNDGLTSRKLARIFQDSMLDMLGLYDRGIKERSNLYVLRNTTMPAVIVEVGFMDNAHDAAKLKDEKFVRDASLSMYRAILETFEKYPTNR
ncbi:N-acetylmuramoyl-L-alanine amidase [Natranaerovirga hydrolytica]|uniref:N-acetylmuramoyl-L-alanine amidase n=1 Tax=Natranaerovirga hydrolytica TaxID=680378 RepID=A0A4R1ME68_9FIRM|nr:N-acetylmuramoyl-L-alanine amidase family protein [Natranaerovirga hydrolytica]TCK90495.1 N-acetylmuramoyl-L-alanine amidase [Natranaerovirga hydrolytica]